MSYPFVWDFTSSLWKVAGFWSDLMHAYQRTVKKICLYIRYLLCLFWAVKSNLTYLFTEWDRSIPQWITQRSLGILPKSTGRSSNWKCIYVCIMHINFWGDCLLFQGYKSYSRNHLAPLSVPYTKRQNYSWAPCALNQHCFCLK